MSAPPAISKRLPRDPYRGILPFRYSDRPIFFARETEVRQLLRQVATYRCVLLYGDSGAGKSSLINAGLLPITIEEGFRPERVRVQPKLGEEIVLERISEFTYGRPPYLASSLAPPGGRSSRVVIPVAELRDRLVAADSTATPLLIF